MCEEDKGDRGFRELPRLSAVGKLSQQLKDSLPDTSSKQVLFVSLSGGKVIPGRLRSSCLRAVSRLICAGRSYGANESWQALPCREKSAHQIGDTSNPCD
ncbi:hypothetical protein AAFF_G00423760 [Aldrovandia affinis]|uniref:Uncharacterized protein n=1 Tax=Aldrovandia affinis TaxID=143900 RepID=A0AAD7T6R0_9TELE|nr:hypothetical protein AAFF_G00423760 [Aldrovandia affinis]